MAVRRLAYPVTLCDGQRVFFVAAIGQSQIRMTANGAPGRSGSSLITGWIGGTSAETGPRPTPRRSLRPGPPHRGHLAPPLRGQEEFHAWRHAGPYRARLGALSPRARLG